MNTARTETVNFEILKSDLPVLKDCLQLYLSMQELWIKLKLTSDAERILAMERRVVAQVLLVDVQEAGL